MSDDIISRLRELAKPGTSLADVGGTCVFTEAANEIAHLREAIRRPAGQDATLSVCNGTVTVTMDATLTDEEREAMRFCSVVLDMGERPDCAATLRKLLERLK